MCVHLQQLSNHDLTSLPTYHIATVCVHVSTLYSVLCHETDYIYDGGLYIQSELAKVRVKRSCSVENEYDAYS